MKHFLLFTGMACCTLLSSCDKKGTRTQKPEPVKNHPPISITFSESTWHSGQVLQVRNTSDTAYLSCKLTVQNTTNGKSRCHNFSIKPAELKEIGVWEMDWSFKTGETICIETEGFNTVSYIVP